MLRVNLVCLFGVFAILGTVACADQPMRGTYVEARTCQVYTGPCFANGEVGLTGKDALMTWQVEDGKFAGVDLKGLGVALIVKGSHTLGFNGFEDAKLKKAMLIVDEEANTEQADALRKFALHQTGLDDEIICDVKRSEINMDFNYGDVTAKVSVGKYGHLDARRARKGDCICSNESAYYPPLAKLSGFVPGVTIDGGATARSLGVRWEIPDSRTAYLGTFEVDASEEVQIATNL
ncbi:MAG: DUF1326 domain-containing protein [Planctomycetales bacterium]|nr:DUF1326 domain-containing protein [Planctomycetales bacterium]